jgi:alanyl-tRNA synthetase
MKLSHTEIRNRYKKFLENKGHKEVPPIPLIPQNDPTTLFTGSGMQQFVPNLLGEPHPLGTRLFNIQRCIRAQDIEEVGDNRHDTCFEMMGNWSLGDYFKKEQLNWLYDYFTNKEYGLGLDPHKLYASVFKGEGVIPKDEESIVILKEIFNRFGIEAKAGEAGDNERITVYEAKKNWWSRAGTPTEMPAGEPGGPDSEVFYDFGEDYHFHENSPWKDGPCHVNCDCGRFLEIGNSVFVQYKKDDDGSFKKLPKQNVDFGGGIERIAAAVNDNPDIFTTDLYSEIIKETEKVTGKKYEGENKVAMRVVSDHLKGSVFLIVDGVRPSNKEQGYVLRRLLRRAAVKLFKLTGKVAGTGELDAAADAVLSTYDGVQHIDKSSQREMVIQVINDEMDRFAKSLDKGLKEIQKVDESKVDGKFAFDLYQNFGFPFELTEELLREKGHKIDREQFKNEFEKHRNLSRTASAGKFKGGLADHSEQVVRYHTATHLIHQALFDVMGNDVRQEGSNITGERLRFDFYSPRKPTEEDIKKVTEIVNENIKKELPVHFKIMPKEEANKIGAKSFFREKYPDMVKVYYIGNEDPSQAYSKEFCGGPHITNTKEIGKIEIYKTEKIGSNLFRIYAK